MKTRNLFLLATLLAIAQGAVAQGIAYVEGNVDDAAVRAKVVELGFENG